MSGRDEGRRESRKEQERTSFSDRLLEVWVGDDEKERELLVKRIGVPGVVQLKGEETTRQNENTSHASKPIDSQLRWSGWKEGNASESVRCQEGGKKKLTALISNRRRARFDGAAFSPSPRQIDVRSISEYELNPPTLPPS